MEIKINPKTQTEVSDEINVEQTTEVTQPETEQPRVEEQPKANVEGAFTDKVPANWQIKPTENGIEAYNANSRETFVGSIAEFNQKLRG